MFNSDWDIKPRSTACAHCQTAFQDGQDLVSALIFGENGYLRRDFCQNCWVTSPPEASQAISIWKTAYEAPPPPPPEPFSRENVERMLRHLIAVNVPFQRNVIYILAVILERRRILIERDVKKQPNGEIMRIYEHRRTGETFLIYDPQLDLAHLEQVHREVQDLLENPNSVTPVAPNAASPTMPPAP